MTQDLQQDVSSPEEGKQDPIANPIDNSSNDVSIEAKEPLLEVKEAKEVEAKTKPEAKDYPDDWREKIAKDDEKVLKKLQRLKTPEDLAKSYLELEKKFSETRPKFQLPEKPTAEDIAKYREENGVPAKAEDYDLNLDGGLVIGDDDKPAIDAFIKKAHEKNMPASELKNAVQSYFEAKAEADGEMSKFIESNEKASEKELKETWGNKISENKNKIATFLTSQFGEDGATLLDLAVFRDGTNLATNPKMLNKFLELANQFHSTPSDTASNTKVSDINTEIASLKQMIREGTYYNNPANPQRMAELIELQSKMK